MTTCYYPHSYATFYSFDHVTLEVQNISKEHSQKIKIFLELMKSTNILVSKNRVAIKLIRLITNDNQLDQSISQLRSCLRGSKSCLTCFFCFFFGFYLLVHTCCSGLLPRISGILVPHIRPWENIRPWERSKFCTCSTISIIIRTRSVKETQR